MPLFSSLMTLHVVHIYIVFVQLQTLKMDLHNIRFSSALVPTFCFSVKNYVLFRSHFYMSVSALIKTVTYWSKVFRKKIFVKGYGSVLKYRTHRLCTLFLSIRSIVAAYLVRNVDMDL